MAFHQFSFFTKPKKGQHKTPDTKLNLDRYKWLYVNKQSSQNTPSMCCD